MIKRLIHGAPLKHPLHPGLVHFPIALFIFSVLLDVANLLRGGEAWLSTAAYYSLAMGLLFALLAAVPGLIDWTEIRVDHPGKSRATLHMLLNLTAVAILGASFWLRRGEMGDPVVPLLPFFLSSAGVLVILFSGYLGGWLVYDQGIGVGRYRRWTDLPDRTIEPKAGAEKSSFIPVGEASSLKDGETLRVEVQGEVMAVIRVGDEVYAINEFCTHRFGPLSDGALHDHQVECPWHRSCFDIRTGKVTQGPAKVDLKSYPVEVRDGMIYVQPESKT